MHLALFLFYVALFGITFVWPSWRVWRRDRINPLVLPRDDSPHGFVGSCFKLVLGGVFVGLGALAAGAPDHLFGPLRWLERPPLAWAGWGLMVLSVLWIALAQRQMGRSWRIGIDTREQPPLVQEGVFARSRNPIFLGMRLNLLGLFLALPNAMTAATFLLAEVLMQVHVRLEEEHLRATFGAKYAAYAGVVRRWL